MVKKLAITFLCLVAAKSSFAQGVAFFQDGAPLSLNGIDQGLGIYDGTIDTEFRAANPTDEQGSNTNISVDQFDGGFQTQGAIRFENLLVSQGGLIPDELIRGGNSDGVIFAEFSIWKQSPSQSNANIDFSRVTRPDTTTGEYWQLDDTWASLGGDLIPDGAGLLNGDPINRQPDFNNGILEASTLADNDPADFQDNADRFDDDDVVVLDPNEGPVQSRLIYTTDQDSEDVFDAAWDGTPEDLNRAIDVAYWRFDVTEAIRGWVEDTDPNTAGTQPLNPDNFGWAISNDTGDGWDFLSSDLDIIPEGEFEGLDPAMFRPSLTIIFDDGSAGPADIDKDGDVDLFDFDLFADLIASELDGPLATGSPGDFDFNRVVNLDDFKEFKERFETFNGTPLEAALATRASVPEPSAIALVLLALCGLTAGRSRRRS